MFCRSLNAAFLLLAGGVDSTFTASPWSCLPGFAPFCYCSAPLPSIPSVCLIAGDGHVVYLKQNRTPLLFQRVEPPTPDHDGGPGLNNALPPPEKTDAVNSLWVSSLQSVSFWLRSFLLEEIKARRRVCVLVWMSQTSGGRDPREPIVGYGSCSGHVPEGWQLESRRTRWGRPAGHEQLTGTRHSHSVRTRHVKLHSHHKGSFSIFCVFTFKKHIKVWPIN